MTLYTFKTYDVDSNATATEERIVIIIIYFQQKLYVKNVLLKLFLKLIDI